MKPRTMLHEVADVRQGSATYATDIPTSEGADARRQRVFGLQQFAYSERVKPRYASPMEDNSALAELRKGDIVVGLSGEVLGETVLVGRRFDGAVLGRDCAAIRLMSDSGLIPDWFYAWTRTQDYRGQVEREVAGTAIRRLTPHALRSLSVPMFTQEEQQRLAGNC